MNRLVLLVSFLAFASAQFPDVPGVPGPRWTGPIANHVLGQRVPDTPEVAAAKAQHAQAHISILQSIPVLPAEERYGEEVENIPQPPPRSIPQPQIHLNTQQQQQQHLQHNNAPIQTSPKYTQFAEEIPRSQIGEVPEVDAARQAHLAAFNKIKAALPNLPEEPVNNNPSFPAAPQQYIPQYNQFNQNGF